MATAEQYANWIVKNKDKKGTPEFDTVVSAYKAAKQPQVKTQEGLPESKPPVEPESRSNIPIFQMARESPFLKGMIDPAAGGAQLASELGKLTSLGDQIPDVSKHVRGEEKAYQQNRGEDAGIDFGRIAGNIVSPASLASMGGSVPAKLLPRIGQGMKLGAGMGAAQPTQGENFWTDKAKQTAIGAGTGGVLPIAAKGAKSAASYVDELTKPMYQKGIARDVKKFVVEQAGDQRQKIVDALQKAKGKTAGQAIAKARQGGDEYGSQFIKLEQELAKEPLEGVPLRSTYGKQTSERQKIIDAIAGTDEKMTLAKTARKSSTRPLYKAVEESRENVDIGPVTSKIDDVLAKNKNETNITTPLNNIRGKMDDTSPQALYSLSKEIKSMMGKTTTGGQKEYNVGVLNDIKKTLDEQIGLVSAPFKAAQASYKKLSDPINKMNVGKELQGALTTALERESPSTFTTAVSKAPRTLKRATGFPRFNELGDVLSPDQVSKVQRVSDELINLDKARRMGSSVGSVMKELPGEVSLSLPHVLSRPVVVANHILGMVGKDQTPEYKRLLVKMLQDPRELEKALTLPVSNPKRKMAMDMVNKISTITTSQTAAREGGTQ